MPYFVKPTHWWWAMLSSENRIEDGRGKLIHTENRTFLKHSDLGVWTGDHAVAFVGVSTLIKPLPSSNIIGFPHEVRAQVEDLGVRPLQNSTMLPTRHCSPAYSGVLKINADPWLKPVTFHSSTQQELGQSKSKFLWGPCCCFRFWYNWRGKEDPSMNPRKITNLLSAWKKPGSEHSILQSEEGHKNKRGWLINLLLFKTWKFGNY